MEKQRKQMSRAAGASTVVDVYVKLPSGRTLTIDLLPRDKVEEIYNYVAEEERVASSRVVLKYTGKVLKRMDTIGYLGICAETILKAEIITIKKYHIYVKLPSGKTVPLEIENVSPLRYIKDQLFLQESIPTERQHLKFEGRLLSQLNQSVMDAGIKEEAVLDLEDRDVTGTKDTEKRGETEALKGAANVQEEPAIEESTKQAVLSSFDSCGKNVEVVFSFDTTGSMYSCLQQVRDKLRDAVTRLIEHIPNIRVSIIAHGDYCDQGTYVVRHTELTSDVDTLADFVRSVPSTGGGDSPECYEWVLRKAQLLDWSEDAAKALVVIGDCEPHGVNYTDQKINWHDELDVLKGMGVKVYGVQAMNNDCAKPFYEQLADRTGGAYINFSNFSIITEMFLAVCYREASAEQYDAFCEEVMRPEAAEDMAVDAQKDIRQVLDQLEEQRDRDPEEPRQRYVAVAWWDPLLDHSSPRYTYDAATDRWATFTPVRDTGAASHVTTPRPAPTDVTTTSGKQRRAFSFRRSATSRSSRLAGSPSSVTGRKKGCSIM